MSSQSEQHDVAVVGGGVDRPRRGVARGPARPAHARARRRRGRRVARRRRHARAGHRGWSSASASCSASGLRALDGFPGFCAELERRATGLDTARSSSRATATRPRSSSSCSSTGASSACAVERLRPSQARRAEPALAPTVRLALDVPGDGAVDPRKLVAALSRRGGSAPAARSGASASTTSRALSARQVVVAPRAPGRARLGSLPVRPVKGQIMRLRDPQGQDLVDAHDPQRERLPRPARRRPLRARRDVEERGWDTAPTAGGVYELMRDLAEVVPGVLELEIEELGAGPAPRHARQPAGRSAEHARRRSCGPPATSATASCSPPSPRELVAELAQPATRCRTGPPRADPRALRGGRRMNVIAQRRADRARRRRHRRGRARRARAAGADRGVAVAVDAEVVPRGEWAGARVARGRAGRGPARDPGRLKWRITDTRTDVRPSAAAS